MGQVGSIDFFCEYDIDVPHIIQCIFEYFGSSHPWATAWSDDYRLEWDLLMQQQADGNPDYTEYTRDLHVIHQSMTVMQFCELSQKHFFTMTYLLKNESQSHRELYADLESIPSDIRGSFVPASPIIHIGPHDLIDFAEHDHGHLLGRCNFSLSLHGQSTPHDWQAYRSIVFELPSVKRLKAFLEDLIGTQVQQVVYWNI